MCEQRAPVIENSGKRREVILADVADDQFQDAAVQFDVAETGKVNSE